MEFLYKKNNNQKLTNIFLAHIFKACMTSYILHELYQFVIIVYTLYV